MRIEEWEARYRGGERHEDFVREPTPLVVRMVEGLTPGTALDLACGTGRNSVWLAERGWKVTAVDGSQAAIESLRQRTHDIRTRVADLERGDFEIEPASWDLILKCYYLQRSLIPAVRAGVRTGGTAVVIAHLANPGEATTYKHLAAGELRAFFADWEVLHYFEGLPNDSAHKRSVAEVVTRKMGQNPLKASASR